jgi:hypothetical protein
MTRLTALRFAAAVALGAGSIVAAPAQAAEPLPQCRIDDVRTRYTQLVDWRRPSSTRRFACPAGTRPLISHPAPMQG